MFRTITIIDLQDWDKLVSDTYHKPYYFQQQDGCQPRGLYEFSLPDKWGVDDFENTEIPFEVSGEEMGVSFETWLNTSPEDTEKHFNPSYKWENEMFWHRNFYPNISCVIDDLHKRGLLPDGNYGIKIDW